MARLVISSRESYTLSDEDEAAKLALHFRYGHFGLSSDGKYRPVFERFSGNVTDSLAYSNGEPFSTL